MINKKRIIFLGTPNIAAYYLTKLLDHDFNIIAVYTKPPKKQGRGMIFKKTPVQLIAEDNNIKVFLPTNLSEDKEINNLKKLNADLAIVIGYGILIPKKTLKDLSFDFINIHFSLLPRWRGASPVEHAILNGDTKTGVSIFKIEERLDSGPVLCSENISITESISKSELQKKLSNIGIKLLIENLPKYFLDQINLIYQNEKNITYAKKITSSYAKINFFKNAKEIYNHVRAFNPKPGAWLVVNNERIKILECKVTDKKGQVSEIISEKFLIGCLDKSIQPTLIQREGKKPMVIEEFLRGFDLKIGQKI